MKKAELKQVLKPLIKQCIKEVIFEDGTLSSIISEVVNGLGADNRPRSVVTEERHIKSAPPVAQKKARQEIQQRKRKLLDAIGKETYQGVDLFENTAPLRETSQRGNSLADTDPGDAGVDISNIPGSRAWKHLIK